MFKYIVVRLIWLFIVLLFIVSAMYIMIQLLMWHKYLPKHPFSRDVKLISVQYLDYMKGIFTRWDWGLSRGGDDVWTTFKDKAPITILINVAALIFYIPVGIFLGILSALRKHKISDHVIGVLSMIFSSLPSFIMVFILIIILSYRLNLVPSQYSYAVINGIGSWGWFKGLVIPVLALSILPIANLTRIVRGEISETLEAEYLLLARVKGLKKHQAIFRHALRNSIVPVLPVIATTFVLILCDSFVVELLYSIPGVAQVYLQDFRKPFLDMYIVDIDLNVIVMISSFYVFLSLVNAFFVDIAYRLVDPRMKIGSKNIVD